MVGVGSTFWFTAELPIAAEQDSTQHDPCEQAQSARNHAVTKRITAERILLAEDNLVNQKVALRLLERLGYAVDVVDNGRAAVEAWRSGRYALILMDCQMPEMSGYEATQTIRQLERAGQHTVIVALTADAMKEAQAECLAAGMDDYLSKPITSEQLQACLERFADRSVVREACAG
jgi:CheY-like chemotaxis protein